MNEGGGDAGFARIGPADVARLAAEILDPARSTATVCVTLPSWSSDPFVDPAALGAALGGTASVYLMPTGDESWELTDRLPPRLDVYGGATRVWWPGFDEDADPFDHPLFFAYGPSDSDSVVRKIVDAFERRGLLVRERPELPQPDAEMAGVVTAVRDWGVELTLTGGHAAFAHRSQLSRNGDLFPDQLVRPGQPVRVRIADGAERGRRIPVTLRPFEPDPWLRLTEQYAVGMVIEGYVDELWNIGALVMIYPGVRGLVHKSQISREWVSHPEDFLAPDERIVARIVKIDEADRKVELSLLDIPEDTVVASVATVYPDGPPWLPPEETEDVQEEPAEAEPQQPDRLREAAPTEIEGVAADAAAPESEPLHLSEPTADASSATQEPLVPAVEPPQEPSSQDDELEALERAVEDGRELQRHVDDLFAETDHRLRRLRAEATQIRQLLQRDLTEMRVRILELVETEGAELVGSAESALADARREVDDLRERLAAVEHDRHQLLDRLKTERQRAGDADRRVERLRKELRAEGDSKNRLQRELEALDLDASRRFVAEVYQAWDRVTLPADRARFPWREPIIGPDFLDSLAATQGVSRERVLDVCAHVACGRAAEIGGLELHPLRASEGGGASQLEREDGAKAWRCSLQASTAAARRLHYWQLPDGGVELAKVGYHDDLSIR